jgi:hypothetical protein
VSARPEEVEALARAIDRIVFPDSAGLGASTLPAEITGLISYLNDSFPRMAVIAAHRDRIERRLARALRLPRAGADHRRIETEFSRRLASLDPRWGPVVGGTALVLLGVLGFAAWRRGAIKPAAASFR